MKKLLYLIILLFGYQINYSQEEIIIQKVDDTEIRINLDSLEVIKVINIVSVETLNEVGGVKVFPNPTYDMININLNEITFDINNIELSIIDIDGKKIKSFSNSELLKFKSNDMNFTLNKSNIGITKVGVYILELKVNNNKHISKLIVQ